MEGRIIGIDIGGTTFSSTLFNDNLDILDVSEKEFISKLNSTKKLLDAIANQIKTYNTKIDGIGISCPGPLDSKNGIILETPNLKLLQNINLKKEIESRCKASTYIENDANLFTLGEWCSMDENNSKVLGGVTLGTGLGFGVVINGEIFTGAHGMASEYAISPVNSGNWESKVSISGIMKSALKHIGKKLDPETLYEMAVKKDKSAMRIWSEFGHNLGLALSHFINMLDPDTISIGGGVSGAFKLFEADMKNVLNEYCPSYKKFTINIFESKKKELSSHLGAALLVKKNTLNYIHEI